MVSFPSVTHEAGVQARAGLLTIAVSFHRLFLSGLLPSRARLCFTG